MATSTLPYQIVGPYGQKLYPSASENRAKFRNYGPLARDIKAAISPQDWAETVTLSAKLCARIPALMGAIRQQSEWAFAGDSWQPIFFGGKDSPAWEAWGEAATNWLVNTVFPNAVRGNVNRALIKAMQVSAMGWSIHGDDLALFSVGRGNLPQMTIVPATRIGNGNKGDWTDTVTGGSYSLGSYTLNGYGTVEKGRFEGLRIYNGVIFSDDEEPIAVRVMGMKRADEKWVASFADFELGFEHGAHLASDYDWHGMGRPLPRTAASILRWQQKEQIDANLLQGIDLASRQTVIHKLPQGMDAAEARGNAVAEVIIPGSQTSSGQDETIYVEQTQAGDVKFIGSAETLQGLNYANPHPNVEDFAKRILSECLTDLGWPYELTDLSSTGRAPTRLSCELANNSIWQKQCVGETRLYWFVKFAIATGIRNGLLPDPPPGPPDAPYQWTFGYPAQMSVDAGNDVKAALEKLRFGLTSQRVESARWGYVLDRIRRDRKKEVKTLVDDAAELADYAKAKGHDLPFIKAVEFFWQPSANAQALPAAKPDAEEKPAAPAPNNSPAAGAKPNTP